MREPAPRVVVQAMLAAVAVGGVAMTLTLSLERGAPAPGPLIGALVLAGALFADLRGLAYARGAAIVAVTLALPLVLEEPYLTERASISICLPPLIVLLLAPGRWVVASGGVALLLVLARAGFRGEYMSAGFLIVYAVYIALVALSRHLLARASRQVAEHAESAARERSRAHHSLRALEQAESALREGEARYRLIAENTADVFALFELDGRLVWTSPSLERTLGYTSDLNLGSQTQAFVHPADLPEATAAFEQLGRDGHASAVVRVRHANGAWRWIECHASEVDREGSRLILAVIRDITERRGLEAQLRLSQRLECLGRLAGGVAHDFNNLLTIITGYVHVLRRNVETGSAAEQGLAEIAAAAQRAADLTKQLLAFARRQVLERRRIEFDALVQGTQELLARLIGEDIRLEWQLGAPGALVRVDPAQIEQVLMNLAVNARDAMPHGGRLTIATRRVDAEGAPARVLLTVEDTGVGIAREILPHVWEPFFSTKEPHQGTGLGLATCYGIVEQHGGTTDIDSTLGRGTTVRVWLPLADEQEESPPPPSSRRASVPSRGASILLVEDEVAVRALTGDLLRDSGYVVTEARDGEEALAIAHAAPKSHFDALVTDVVMPRMGGRCLAEQLRQDRPELAVLMLSGYANREAPTNGIPGACFLQKPFTAQALVRAVEDALHAARGQAEAQPSRAPANERPGGT